MTELELFKFINEHSVEYHWLPQEDDVVIFPLFSQIEYLHKLLSYTMFDDEGIPCAMKDGYLAIQMKYICDHYDIEMKNVFTEQTNV